MDSLVRCKIVDCNFLDPGRVFIAKRWQLPAERGFKMNNTVVAQVDTVVAVAAAINEKMISRLEISLGSA